MSKREEILGITRRLLVGPNPLPDVKGSNGDIIKLTQENGEEILFFDSPLKTYVTGVLFPQTLTTDEMFEDSSEMIVDDSEIFGVEEKFDFISGTYATGEPVIEAETSKINTYKQSGMGITFCVPHSASNINISVSAGIYEEKESRFPKEVRDENGVRTVMLSEKERRCFYRKQISGVVKIARDKFPTNESRYTQYSVINDEGFQVPGLAVTLTFRLKKDRENYSIFTVTLLNENKEIGGPSVRDCFFQAEFSVSCDKALATLPDNFWAENVDEDYQMNALLYRDVKTYAIGHGCASTWDETKEPTRITASVLPEYEVKPIVPGESSAKLEMKMYSHDIKEAIIDLELLCNEYEKWIEQTEYSVNSLDSKYKETAQKQISLCKECLDRMRAGVNLLRTNNVIAQAFMFANKAMLLQQLHYKMPLIKYVGYDERSFKLQFEREIIMPDIEDDRTWVDSKKYGGSNVYGKWRPFQIAFILLNLTSISDKKSCERGIVDLIWFPTGGGKTEAYLGLTAFTIFLRRLNNPNDSGTTVMMRYTLRLLTAQQFERAASLICAIEKLRSEKISLLGDERITIGLWVGGSLTSNNTKDVMDRMKAIESGKEKGNTSVMLKCPWCGASMETYNKNGIVCTPGYEKSGKNIVFRCANDKCDYGSEDVALPLSLFDDDIYMNPPTLLFGTVDKFAMLPYKYEAKALFGGDGERTPPELIIQDELHLITGPLGSTVGLYETLISELCQANGYGPKVIASTATISRAKQQCNALYNCGEDNVFQFPPQGISYDDCFFAKEDKGAVGRKYVGLFGSAASSSATASIYTFAAFLYAAKALDVENEIMRDPYWTNLAYFGSMRELGQAATWFIADIKERLEVIYQNRLQTMLKEERRYIYESGLAELTSRMNNDEIPKILKSLEIQHEGGNNQRALDVCLATNMISVGVDIPRLGLMTVTGQPKSMSEYIQATSRVGRSAMAPGLVFVIYNTSKPRDKSHYEKFQAQHSKLYFHVEPTSVTPFARPLRERALHAVFIGLHRFFVDIKYRDDARREPTDAEFDRIVKTLLERAKGIDPDEIEDINKQARKLWEEWRGWKPQKYSSFKLSEIAPLMYPSGAIEPSSWEGIGWATPTSMRSVDRECGLTCGKRLVLPKEEE